eukprot:EG_transcript_21789
MAAVADATIDNHETDSFEVDPLKKPMPLSDSSSETEATPLPRNTDVSPSFRYIPLSASGSIYYHQQAYSAPNYRVPECCTTRVTPSGAVCEKVSLASPAQKRPYRHCRGGLFSDIVLLLS